MKYLFPVIFFIIIYCPAVSQVYAVSGYIYSKESGDAIKNASILEKESGIGTISDSNGYYRLLLKSGTINLDFSADGYKILSQNLPFKSDTSLVVQLIPKQNTKSKGRLPHSADNGTEPESGQGFKGP